MLMMLMMVQMMMTENDRNSEGHTPLMFAVGQGGLNCARYQQQKRQQQKQQASTVPDIDTSLVTIIITIANVITIIIIIVIKMIFFSQLLMVDGIDLHTRDGMGLTLEEVAR